MKNKEESISPEDFQETIEEVLSYLALSMTEEELDKSIELCVEISKEALKEGEVSVNIVLFSLLTISHKLIEVGISDESTYKT
jgi:hypothetical protein